ncbi:MAG: putative F420-dependent oxidoreductase, family [Actinomycetia bacterium]|nr:putative F420-dependent oxidoreductase, family [Actinomycetes bacterium]
MPGSARPFRFGVQTSKGGSAHEWRELARKVEALGYSTLYSPDHFVAQPLAPVVALTFAAEATSTLRVGGLVFDNDYRHPAILAKDMATLDLLSEGRVEMGIGAGWRRDDYAALGLPYDAPAVRVDRFEEALAVIEGCFRGEPFSFTGKHYTITDYTSIPKPVQQPHPPLLIGAGGKRMLSIAARHADIVGVNPNLRSGVVGPDAVRDSLAAQTIKKIEWIREAAGDRFASIELQYRAFVCAITDDAEGFAANIGAAMGIEAADALESALMLAGTEAQVEETILRRREELGLSYVVVGEDSFEALAPVVARLAGI